ASLRGGGAPGTPGTPGTPGVSPTLRSGGAVAVKRTVLFDQLKPYNTSFTYYPTFDLADCAEAIESLLIVVISTCDVAVTAQAIGSLGPQADGAGAFDIGPSESVGIVSRIGLGIDLSVNWYPYIGVTIATGASAPTTGEIVAWAFARKYGG
ncbi:MAG: hypothetical protein Q8O55_08045, partial [Dehalococcoidales bacterium]|nr:hypothetical protein [Dehalococcoidales bacterium]